MRRLRTFMARRSNVLRLYVVMATTLAANGCVLQEPEALDGPSCLVDRIHHGLEGPIGLGLGPEQLAAIVAVYPPDRETICSGVVVAEGVVLTAGHCVDAEAPETLRVGHWSSAEHEATVRSAIVHPQLDVAVLHVDASALPSALDPIPLLDGAIDDAWIGHPVELAGYGSTELGEIGQLRFAAEPVVDVEPDAIVVHGRGRSGACGGDSGGPLLARDDAGRVRVIGLLDSGHASCVQDDRYTRVDVLASWWSFEWREVGGIDRGCEGLDPEGTCVRGHAMWCGDAERIEVQRCVDGSVCGQRPDELGFTCVSPLDDVCEGSGSQAWCDGDQLVRCEGGDQQVTDCGACGQTCASWTPMGGAGCVDLDPAWI